MVRKRRRSTTTDEKEISSTPPVDGMQYTFGNLLETISECFSTSVTTVSLIGSLLSGFYNFSGPVAGALGNKFGFRMVVITGSLVSSSGLMLSYFAPTVEYLYFFYGILGGLGFGMIYMASVITTSLYFEKYRALAASLSVCGTGVGTFVFAPLGNFLVKSIGWRFALVVEGGIILLCILCGLSFKPIEIIRVIPLSKKPSELTTVSSEGTLTRGSLYYSAETKRTMKNQEYPTFKEALLGQDASIDGRRSTIFSIGGKSRRGSNIDSLLNFRRQNPIYSVVGSMVNFNRPEPTTAQDKCRRKCGICCFNFWHCRCKQRDLTLGDRPMYRDDIFYGGSLASLSAYTSSERLNYHLSVTRVPGANELQEHVEQKCCVCHQAVLRTCITMTGFHLLRSKVFVFLCISSFLYTMSLFIPYVFIIKVAKDHNIPDEVSVWLVSAIGISNTAGRLVSGIVKSFMRINGGIFALVCLSISGIFSFIFIITINLGSLIAFSVIFGFFTAPFISLRPVIIVEFLGLEKLTNAFGLVLLSQGVASIIGPPAAGSVLCLTSNTLCMPKIFMRLLGVIEEKTGQSIFTIYLSGSLMLFSSLSLMVSVILHKK